MSVFIKYFCSIIVCSFLFVTDIKYGSGPPSIIIDNLTAITNVSDKFLSVALDTALIKNGHICQINSKKLLERALLLSPAFLRIGGTAADRLIFDKYANSGNNTSDCQLPGNEQDLYSSDKIVTNFTLSGKVWKDIHKFVERCGFHLIFDLNVLLRKDNKWDTTNAQDLLMYSEELSHNTVWQLGNEPNSFRHVFGTPITPKQLGSDFQELRKLLNNIPYYKKSQIVGPDVTRPSHLGESSLHYLRDFLLSINNSTINAITWHQYYFSGRTATLQDFINPNTFNILKTQIKLVNEVVEELLPNTPIWLSETSSAYGGGAPGLSDRYVASFLWLDKLGMAAQLGIDVVIRQTLYYGYYSLLDTHTLEPLPDWWVSILYKKLVGSTVLGIQQFINGSGPIRLYAHCSSDTEILRKGSVITLFGMNIKDSVSNLNIVGTKSQHLEPYISVYNLRGSTGLTSRSISLNGHMLALQQNGTLPELKPVLQSLHSPIQLEPYSLVFLTLHNIHFPLCSVTKIPS